MTLSNIANVEISRFTRVSPFENPWTIWWMRKNCSMKKCKAFFPWWPKSPTAFLPCCSSNIDGIRQQTGLLIVIKWLEIPKSVFCFSKRKCITLGILSKLGYIYCCHGGLLWIMESYIRVLVCGVRTIPLGHEITSSCHHQTPNLSRYATFLFGRLCWYFFSISACREGDYASRNS